MSETTQKYVAMDSVVELLSALQDSIAAKRATIKPYDSYGKETFMAFDSYNLGLTAAMEMVGLTATAIGDLAQSDV